MRKLIHENWLLAVIIVIAFVIRLLAAHVQSFSNDELSALYRLKFSDFNTFLHWGVKVDGHPAFVQLFLFGYTSMVPDSESWIRLPFVMASTLSLIFIFFSIKKIAGEFSAYLVAIIMAFSAFSIQLGYFARPYAFGILFSSATAYYWTVIFIEKKRELKFFIGFIVFGILSAYTHYFALLQLVILGMATFVFINWKLWWKIIVSGTVIFLAFLPHYPITSFQLSVGGIGGWLGKPRPDFIITLIFTFFDSWWVIVAVIATILSLMLLMFSGKPYVRNFLMLMFLSLVPFLILYQYSIRVNSVLQLSACYFFMPFLLSGCFVLAEPKSGINTVKWFVLPLFITYLASAVFIHQFFKPIHFAEFKRIAAYIEEHENDSVTTIVAVNNPAYIDFYLKDRKPDLYITDMGDNLSFLLRYVDTCKTKELIYAFTNQRSNAEIPFLLQSKFGPKIKSTGFVNSAFYHYQRDSTLNKLALSTTPSFVYHVPEKTFVHVDAEFKPGYSSYTMLQDIEFGPTLRIKLSDYDVKANHTMVSQVQFVMKESCDLELVFSVEDEKEVKYWRSRKLYHQLSNLRNPFVKNDSIVTQTSLLNAGIIIAEKFDDPHINLSRDYLKIYLWNPRHCECLVTRHSVWITDDEVMDGRFSQ